MMIATKDIVIPTAITMMKKIVISIHALVPAITIVMNTMTRANMMKITTKRMRMKRMITKGAVTTFKAEDMEEAVVPADHKVREVAANPIGGTNQEALAGTETMEDLKETDHQVVTDGLVEMEDQIDLVQATEDRQVHLADHHGVEAAEDLQP